MNNTDDFNDINDNPEVQSDDASEKVGDVEDSIGEATPSDADNNTNSEQATDNADSDENITDNNETTGEFTPSSHDNDDNVYHYTKSDIPSSDVYYKPAGYYIPPTDTYGNNYSQSSAGNASNSSGSDVTNTSDKKKREKTKYKNTSKSKRIAFVAVLLAACLLFGTLAGFGGAMIALGNPGNPEDISTTPLQDSTTTEEPTPQTGSSSDLIITKGNPTSAETSIKDIPDNDLSIPQVVTAVKDSVVEISTEQLINYGRIGQYISSGAGSGVIIDSVNGKIVTNNHVIAGADTITVRLTNGNEYTATLIGTDVESDVALLQITPNEELTSAVIGNSDSLLVGQDVVAIGNPLGELGGTVTNGIISALEREVIIDDEKMFLMQTNAAVNPGNSGGGLFNLRGELIGIINAKSSGTGVEGLGFAIPINYAAGIVTQLNDFGYVKGRVDCGIEPFYVGDIRTQVTYGLPSYGVYVASSRYTAEGEVQPLDKLISINDTEITTELDIKKALNGLQVGDTITVTLQRNKKTFEVKIVLRESVPGLKQ